MNRLAAILICWAATLGAARAQYAPAAMTSPVPGSVLPANPVTFTWSAGTNVDSYALWLGTASNYSYDLGAWLCGTSRASGSITVPYGTSAVYAVLWSNYTNTWHGTGYTCYARPTLAAMQSPTPGSVLPANPVTFRWSAGAGPTNYALWLGTATNSYDLGAWMMGTSLVSAAMTLPYGGVAIYATLWSAITNTWQSTNITYTPRGGAGDLRWVSMDYRAPGLLYANTNWPNARTDYSLLWRGIRQQRGEIMGWATNSHYLSGVHRSNSILGVHVSDHALHSNTHYNMSNAAYAGSAFWSGSATNITQVWSNWGTATTDGNKVYGEGSSVTRWRVLATPSISVGGGSYVTGDIVEQPGDNSAPAQWEVTADEFGAITELTPYNATEHYHGAYLSEPTGSSTLTTITGSGSSAMVNNTSRYEEFTWHGPMTNIPVSSLLIVTHPTDGSAWTSRVASVSWDYTYITGSNSLPFASTNCGVQIEAGSLTNIVLHPTWMTNAPPTVPSQPGPGDYWPWTLWDVAEGQLLIGPNNLKLWWKHVRLDYWPDGTHLTPGTFFARNWPVIHLDQCLPPFTNILAVGAWSVGVSDAYVIRPGGQVITNSVLSSLVLPAAWTTNGPRLYYGQPAQLVVGAGEVRTLEGDGGVLVVAIGN